MAEQAAAAQPRSQDQKVSRAFNIANAWERCGALTDTQTRALALCAWRRTESSAEAAPRPAVPEAGDRVGGYGEILGSLAAQDAAQSSHKFYKWLSDCETAISAEKESKYHGQLADLCEISAKCDITLQEIDSTLTNFDKILQQQHVIGSRAQHLSSNCDRIVTEKERLQSFESSLMSKLAYFNELDRLSALVHAGSLQVNGQEFVAVLRRLDECIEYLKAHPQFAESAVFTLKYRQLQSRALSTIRNAVQSELQKAARAMQQKTAGVSGDSRAAVDGEQLIFTTFVSDFKTIAGELRGILSEVEARRGRKEYSQLLQDCYALLAETRVNLLIDYVQETLVKLSGSQSLAEFTRSGFHFLMQVTVAEHSLFSQFFSDFDEATSVGLVTDPLCTVLYDLLRPEIVSLNEIEALCEVVDIIKGELIEDRMTRYGDAVASMRPFAARALADTQERLIFSVQTFIRDEVGAYRPAAADFAMLRAGADGGAGTSAPSEAGGAEGAGRGGKWYPTVERTLWALSKLYRSVDVNIFSGLAQEAVAACTKSVLTASKQVASMAAAKGDGPHAPLTTHLFIIAHLLYLREQIAPFDAEFVTVHKELEFSHMRDYLRRVLSGESSLFTMGAENAFLALASQGAPRVVQNQMDSKKELETVLKQSCEAFIMTVTKLMIEPVLSFLAKSTAARALAAGAAAKPLKEHAFAAPPRVAEMLTGVKKAMFEEFPLVVKKTREFLPQATTRDILFRPIMSNVAEACSQMLSLLEAEYTQAELAGYDFVSAEDLQALFATGQQ